MKTLIVFASIVIALVSACGTSSQFTRHSIREQIYHARVFLTVHNLTNVYVFDKSGYFSDSIEQVYNTTVYKEENGLFAVLNPSAQACFRTANTYKQYADAILSADTIGLSVDRTIDLF